MQQIYGTYSGPTWKPNKYPRLKYGRYLWTDAFGVCNYITLFNETGESQYLHCADALIQDVHDTLGKDRSLTKRLGNATDAQPTLGGLRIGKSDPENTRDGDGQYFHYLTKWMFALNRMSLATDNAKYNSWAVDMAKAVYPNFVYCVSSNYRMYWKISIDMSKPLVLSEANLDPYDGYVTYKLLQKYSSTLETEISQFLKMVNNKYKKYQSSDPLDLGETLWIAHICPDEPWSQYLSSVAFESLITLYGTGEFKGKKETRLAFREFGICIGIQCHKTSRDSADWKSKVDSLLEFWEPYLNIRDTDITPMMYCASLFPGVWKFL